VINLVKSGFGQHKCCPYGYKINNRRAQLFVFVCTKEKGKKL